MRPEDLRARALRLDELSRGLMKEEAGVKECEDPLLHVERRAYLGSLGRALDGVEGARVALAKALQWIEEATAGPGG